MPYEYRLEGVKQVFKYICMYFSGAIFLFFIILNCFHTSDETMSDKLFAYVCLIISGIMFLPALLFRIFFARKFNKKNPYELVAYGAFSALSIIFSVIPTGIFFIHEALKLPVASMFYGFLIFFIFLFQIYYFYFKCKENSLEKLKQMSIEDVNKFVFDCKKSLDKFATDYRRIMILPKFAVVSMMAIFVINSLLNYLLEDYPVSIFSGFFLLGFFLATYTLLGLFSHILIIFLLLPWQFERKFKKKLIMV